MKIFDIHTHIYPDAIAERAVTALGKFYDFVPQGKGTYADAKAPEYTAFSCFRSRRTLTRSTA